MKDYRPKINASNDEATIDNQSQDKIKPFKDHISPPFLAKMILIKGENRREFYDYVLTMLKELKPSTKMQEEIFKKYIFSGWKLRRAQIMEKNRLNRQQVFDDEEITFSRTKKRIRNLKRIELTEDVQEIIAYQEKLEKQMVKTLRQFREEQKLTVQK